MIRTCLLGLIPLMLAACGDGGGSGGTAGAPAEPEPLTEAEKQAILAEMPPVYQDADLERGRQQFMKCRSCHTIAEGGMNMVGPNLHGVFGREVGTKEGFNYSSALKEADFIWEPDHLEQWLADPKGYLPGNRMSFVGIANEEDRHALIAYLKVETSR